MRMLIAGLLLVLALPAVAAGQCGRITADSTDDRGAAERFCRTAIVNPGIVTAIRAYDTLLYLTVSEPMARQMLADTLKSEALVKLWMGLWRRHSGHSIVTVYVMWSGVEVARGDHSILGRERVRFRGGR